MTRNFKNNEALPFAGSGDLVHEAPDHEPM